METSDNEDEEEPGSFFGNRERLNIPQFLSPEERLLYEQFTLNVLDNTRS